VPSAGLRAEHRAAMRSQSSWRANGLGAEPTEHERSECEVGSCVELGGLRMT
jgi:hypothetical protein